MASKRGPVDPRGRQFSGHRAYSDGADWLLVPAFFRRLRPPRDPRRVFFFGLGCSAPSWPFPDSAWTGSGSPPFSLSSSRPSARSGRWILGAGSPPCPSAVGSTSPLLAAAAAGLRRLLRPPREPRRVFFFGLTGV